MFLARPKSSTLLALAGSQDLLCVDCNEGWLLPVSPELFVPLALRSLSGRAREAQLCVPCTAPGALAGPVVSFPGGAPDARSPDEAGLGKALLMGGV